jgi:PAS domain S-box-containing protein
VRNRLYIILAVCCYLVVVASYTIWSHHTARTRVLDDIDRQLLLGAQSLKHILPPDYHDRAIAPDSIDAEEYHHVLKALSEYTWDSGFLYAYTAVRRNGTVYLTSSNASREEWSNQDLVTYYEEYDDVAPEFVAAFEAEGPRFITYTDEWGTVRSALVPMTSPGGERYIVGLDYSIDHVEGLLRQNVWRTLITSTLLLLAAVPIFLAFFHSSRKHAVRLRKANEELSADIAARKKLERDLLRTQFIVDQSPEAAYWVDMQGQFIYVNQAACASLKYEREELLQMGVVDVDSEMTDDKWNSFLEELKAEGDLTFEATHCCKDGSELPVEVTVAYEEFSGEGIACGFARDIRRRLQAQADLRESQQRFQRMLAAVPDMISIHDADMNILYSNWQGFANVPEKRRVLGAKCYKTYRGNDARCPDCKAHDVLSTGQPWQGEIELDNGRWVELHVIPLLNEAGKADMYMEWVRDITETRQAEADRERLQEQLNQAQKMEAIGRLAGGVAHDFNNMLSVILGNAEMAARHVPADHEVQYELGLIRQTARRSAELTRQLLAFARKQTASPRVLDLNDKVEAILKMLGRLIGEAVELKWDPGKPLPHVKVDPSQVDQILANLVVNARDAIDGGGTIRIDTSETELDDAYCAIHADAHPGRYVTLTVTDDGCGMDAETRARIFEPFFTTKPVGSGTGLGLATVYGIAKQNGGFIEVDSQPDHGTAVRIYLPVTGEETQTDTPPGSAVGPPVGHETILLVEDEPALLTLAQRMLERLGYQVIAANTPKRAMAAGHAHDGEIDLLVTDVVMPEMNGRELAERLLEEYPEMKRLFVSGYTADVIASQGVLEPDVCFLQKPFAERELATSVREVLDA